MNLSRLFVGIQVGPFGTFRVNTAIFNAKPFDVYQKMFQGHKVVIEAMVAHVLCPLKMTFWEAAVREIQDADMITTAHVRSVLPRI